MGNVREDAMHRHRISGVGSDTASAIEGYDAVAHAKDFFEIRRGYDDTPALIAKTADQTVNLRASADIHAAGRLVQKQGPGGALIDQTSERKLLLIAAGQIQSGRAD